VAAAAFLAARFSFDPVFRSTLFADYDAVMVSTSQVGADTVITVDADNAVTLLNVNMSSLHRDDFAFV
jgi:glucose-6-phosphate dehydrogenase assembly protein OpcA